MNRRAITGVGAFLAGFLAVVLLGKGVNGYVLTGFNDYAPNGIYLQGLVLGSLNGLLAMGLVLVYRTNRIINFAQGELGAFGATLAAELIQRFHWPYVPAIGVSLMAAVLMSAAVEFLVIRRFSKAPRLILTVATIAVAQILGAFELILPYLLNKHAKLEQGFKTPISAHFSFGGIVFKGDHIAVLLVTPFVILGLLWFLRGTGYGLAARATADNDDRARLLGVRVKRVSLLVWVIAGFLSAVTAILQAPVVGFQFGAISGFTLLLRALAAGVIARMESLPIAFGAAVLLTTAQQVLFFCTGRSGPDNGLMLIVIIVALLVQRRRMGRMEGGTSSWQAVQEIRPIPTELRDVPEVKYAKWGLSGAGIFALVLLPLILSPSRATLASVIMIYAMVGVSLVMLTGWSGNVSFGQWALVGVGGLGARQICRDPNPQDFFVCLLAGAVAGALVAVIIGLPALRIRGLFLGVTTLAFAVATGSWIFTFGWLTPNGAIRRPVMFGIWDVSRDKPFYFICLIFLIAALVVARNLRTARFGRVTIAMRDNEKGAQALGVPFVKTKLLAFAASGFFAALAGGLYAYHEQTLRADRFPADISLLMFSMVVIGGMGSPSGAILGALFIRGTQYFLPQQFQLLVTGVGVLLLLLFFPGGLGQLFFMARDAYLRGVADRRGLLVPSLVADRRMEVDMRAAAVSATGEASLTT